MLSRALGGLQSAEDREPKGPSMSATKATAGGIAGAAVILINYLLNLVPFIRDMPADPKGALMFIVSSGVVYASVYFAPPNKYYADDVRYVEQPPADYVSEANPRA